MADLVAVGRRRSRYSGVGRTAMNTTLAGFGVLAGMGLVLAMLGVDPATALRALVRGSVGSSFARGQTVMLTCVLALLALAAAVPFRARMWNVGTEGQLYAGALCAVAIALEGPANAPLAIALPLLCVSGMLGGAIWALIAAVLRTKLDANEVIVTLMLQFVAVLLVSWASLNVWPSGLGQQTETLPQDWWMPKILGMQVVTVGAVIGVVVLAGLWVVLTRSDLGYRISAVGHNSRAAQLAGIRVDRTRIASFVLGGACAGLAGAILVAGWYRELIGEVAFGFGFLGIAAALVGRLSPLGIVPAAFLFAALTNGSNTLRVEAGISPAVGSVLIGVLVIGLLGAGVIRMTYPEVSE